MVSMAFHCLVRIPTRNSRVIRKVTRRGLVQNATALSNIGQVVRTATLSVSLTLSEEDRNRFESAMFIRFGLAS